MTKTIKRMASGRHTCASISQAGRAKKEPVNV